MSAISSSSPTYLPCLYIDTAKGTYTPGTYNFSAFKSLLAEKEAAYRTNGPTKGTAQLTSADIGTLAQQYDPGHMSQADYSSLIERLVSKGVLSRDETYDIGLDRMIIRPGRYTWGSLEIGRPKNASASYTLAAAGGDAVAWTQEMARQYDRSDRFQAEAFRKVADILEKLSLQRQAYEQRLR